MSYNDVDNPNAEPNGLERGQEKPLDDRGLILSAISMLISDICLARFELLMTTDQDPLEIAKEVIESLDRYDFLSDLAVSNGTYLELKKRIENRISNEAERVIREQNPR